MNNDVYLRVVLTAIAAALIYLCVLLTPLPVASAQAGRVVGAPTPGVSTGPAEMVVVGWKVAQTLPVTVAGGEVRVTNESLRVSGTVQAEQAPNTATRTVVIGWEERGDAKAPGQFRELGDPKAGGMPVSVREQP